VIAAPAMNTHMWQHPLTARHISLLRKLLRWRVLMPMIKRLACNEVGQGAMQSIWSVAAAARAALGLPVDASLTTAIAAAEQAAAAGVAAATAAAAVAAAAAASSAAISSSSSSSSSGSSTTTASVTSPKAAATTAPAATSTSRA
jgi:phosphopantothenoylcysteine synthetase/decarboxylase